VSKTEREKMVAGELYRPGDPELEAQRAAARRWMLEFNAAFAAPNEQRQALLRARLGSVGAGVDIRSPFFCDYGFNIHVGNRVFLNFDCVILDVAEVFIGDDTQIGPAVQIYAADHPRDPVERRSGLELGRPVRIGRNVWIGGGSVIVPGVTVGDDVIIGAGSVVTRDVPSGATVVGNPARSVR
jgi:maltose O-acetyltransferase